MSLFVYELNWANKARAREYFWSGWESQADARMSSPWEVSFSQKVTRQELENYANENWALPKNDDGEEDLRNFTGIDASIFIFAETPITERKEYEMKLHREIKSWANCSPAAMSRMSPGAIRYALEDARHDILTMARLLCEAGYPRRGTPEESQTINDFAAKVQVLIPLADAVELGERTRNGDTQ